MFGFCKQSMHGKISDLLFELGVVANAELLTVSTTKCTAFTGDWLLKNNPAF